MKMEDVSGSPQHVGQEAAAESPATQHLPKTPHVLVITLKNAAKCIYMYKKKVSCWTDDGCEALGGKKEGGGQKKCLIKLEWID